MLAAVKAERARRGAEADRLRTAQDAAAIRARCTTLSGFVREAWHVLEPNTEYVHNWHIDAICAHLEAVTEGRINRLLINVPPGSMKSLLVSVLWPAWEWGPKGLRSMRYLTTSFAEDNVKRDTRKHRDLTISDWFQALWPEVRLVRTGELSFANSATGTREGVAFGSLTSRRGDRLIVDDPHSTTTAESDVERATTVRQFREGATNRLNDQKKSAIVIVMQRLHEEDVSGTILKYGLQYVHLCLPMELDAAKRCQTVIGFQDPRTDEGELLDPIRFPRDAVEDLKRDMGPYAYAGQYGQTPGPRDGAFFQKSWFRRYSSRPNNLRIYMSSDHAPTGGPNSDYTCVRVWGVDPIGDLYLLDGFRKQQTMDITADMIAGNLKDEQRDPTRPRLEGLIRKWEPFAWFPEADNNWKTAEPFIIKRMKAEGVLTRIEPISPHGSDKVAKAQSIQGMAAMGSVWIPEGAEGDDIVQQYITFPTATHDDEVDAGAIMGRAIAMAHPAIVPHRHEEQPAQPKGINEMTFNELLAAQRPSRDRV